MGEAETARTREIRERLRVLEDGAPSALEWFVPELTKLVDGDRGLSVQLRIDPTGLDVDKLVVVGTPLAPLQADFSRVLREEAVSFTNWNPICPEPEQRNRPVSVVDLLGWEGLRAPPIYSGAIAPHGLGDRDQLRTLVCDGPALLGWVGALRPTPFTTREIRLFGSLVPALQRRLLIERHLAEAPAVFATLDVVLEAVPSAAYVVRGRAIVHANAMGRAALEADPVRRRSELIAAVDARGGDGVIVTPVTATGVSQHFIVFDRRPGPNIDARLQSARRRWGLTRRQLDVLRELARGEANKSIAVRLGCSERTTEVHVTALLQKSGSGSRSELVAKFWTDET